MIASGALICQTYNVFRSIKVAYTATFGPDAGGVVTAPSLAELTNRAYLYMTPDSYRTGGGVHAASRAAIVSAGRSTLIDRAPASSEMTSPSRMAAMGPPEAASGATCPTMRPRVAPENRPSVTSATESPSPMPTSAAVTASISRMPGPPRGPSYRITTASPAPIAPALTAAEADSSESNTRAGPLKVVRLCPDSLTTQPSGARLPRRITSPPDGLSGFDAGRTTSCPGVSSATEASSPIVRPVTVIALP